MKKKENCRQVVFVEKIKTTKREAPTLVEVAELREKRETPTLLTERIKTTNREAPTLVAVSGLREKRKPPTLLTVRI